MSSQREGGTPPSSVKYGHFGRRGWAGLLAGAVLGALGLGAFGLTGPASAQAAPRGGYYRLQLKYDGQYLDADHCTARLALNPGSSYAGGACQLWRLVPNGGGYYRLQLKSDGQYLDADHCASPVTLNPGSTFADGACEQWRFISAGQGWYRLQLKYNGQYLDADHCTAPIGLNPGSSFANGACQLWRLVPASVRFD